MKKCIALNGESGYFNSTGKLGICCNDTFQGNREDYSILDYKKRQEFLKNKSLSWDDLSFCQFCKQNEEKGYKSIRQFLNDKKDIFELNINVGNICNLRCAMCRPEFSYLLSQDISNLPSDFSNYYKINHLKKYELSNSIKQNIENFILTIEKPIEVKVLGGEPLSNEDIINWFMHLLNEYSNIKKFRITTNLTYNTKRSIYLAEHEKVRITASVEGFEDSYEWGRFGAKWKTVAKNLLFFNECIGNRLNVHSILNAISILGDEKLSKFLKENNINNTKLFLTYPEFLQLKVLNERERNALNLTNIEEYDENLRNLFETYMLSLEKTRKQPMPKSISEFFGINRDN
jgi:MoaA/NifB/PqqE/SkfB family radical SAM enzyme